MVHYFSLPPFTGNENNASSLDHLSNGNSKSLALASMDPVLMPCEDSLFFLSMATTFCGNPVAVITAEPLYLFAVCGRVQVSNNEGEFGDPCLELD